MSPELETAVVTLLQLLGENLAALLVEHDPPQQVRILDALERLQRAWDAEDWDPSGEVVDHAAVVAEYAAARAVAWHVGEYHAAAA